MKHLILSVLVFSFTACAHTTIPSADAPAPAAPVASIAPPCNPGHSILAATLWVQSSAEYEAAALGTYAAARLALDRALADPAWVGATEETTNGATQPPAIILDSDETVFDNSKFQARVIRAGQTFDKARWVEWVNEAAATAVPGSVDFVNYARSRGVTPFFITNRDHPQETEGTRRNLEKLGLLKPGESAQLMLRGGREEWKSDKSSRRGEVAANYHVLLLLGDDLNDFANAREATHEQRASIIEERASWWGTRWFMLPNPMYGSWERAAIGSGGTPCEQVQREIDALVER